MSLLHKRTVAGIYVVLLSASALNYYFGWGYFGKGRVLLAVVTLIGVVVVHRFGPSFLREIEAYRAAKRSTASGTDGR